MKGRSSKQWIGIGFGVILIFVVGICLWGLRLFLNWGPVPEPPLATTSLPTFIPNPNNTPTAPFPASETVLPAPAGYTWRLVAEDLNLPVGLVNAQDSSGRLFVIERRGLIRIWLDGQILPKAFLNIRDRVGSGVYEQGLLALAFHPLYEENGYFWVNYTDEAGRTIIARYQVSSDPNIADPGTELRYFEIKQPYANHNGGDLVFGPDGYLYISLGDGGAAADPHQNGQNPNVFLGKILRIDVDSQPGEYLIPPDNPFVSGGGAPEVWAYGLRNPWRITFDALTGELYIGDVGQNIWEEINFLPADAPGGANFGWNFREGRHDFQDGPPTGFESIDPIAEYQHKDNGCSVTGGEVYRGSQLPEWQGVYLYADYCSGKVWGLVRDTAGAWLSAELFDLDVQVVSFGAGEDGEIYLVAYSGEIYRLERK